MTFCQLSGAFCRKWRKHSEHKRCHSPDCSLRARTCARCSHGRPSPASGSPPTQEQDGGRSGFSGFCGVSPASACFLRTGVDIGVALHASSRKKGPTHRAKGTGVATPLHTLRRNGSEKEESSWGRFYPFCCCLWVWLGLGLLFFRVHNPGYRLRPRFWFGLVSGAFRRCASSNLPFRAW